MKPKADELKLITLDTVHNSCSLHDDIRIDFNGHGRHIRKKFVLHATKLLLARSEDEC